MRRLFFCCCAAMVFFTVLAFALFASAAGAADIIESQEPAGLPETAAAGWQAGLCTKDPCSAETPELFFKQAAGHPPMPIPRYWSNRRPSRANPKKRCQQGAPRPSSSTCRPG